MSPANRGLIEPVSHLLSAISYLVTTVDYFAASASARASALIDESIIDRPRR